MELLRFMNILIIPIILTIVFNINGQTLITFGQFIPSARHAASSEIIGDRLYIMGGEMSTGNGTTTLREVIYLDLSKDFNSSSSPPWVDYSQINLLPVLNSWAGSCKDKDNKTIYVFGCVLIDINTNNFITDNNKQIYVFDSVKNTWTTPIVTGISVAPARRREMKVTMDDLGKMYVFGGASGSAETGSNITTWYNDMTIFDSNQLTWTQATPLNPPTARVDFTTTYLPKNKLIVYIGGVMIGGHVNINEVAD